MNIAVWLVSAMLAQADWNRLPATEPLPAAPVRFVDPPRALSLGDLERMAETRHPSLAQSLARLEAARGRWWQAGLCPNPRLSYEAMQVGNFGHAGMQGGAVMQEFVLGGKLRLAREAAAHGVAQAEQQFRAQRIRVLNDLRVEFYSVLAAQRTLDVTRELAAVGDRSLKTAEQQFKVKQAGFVDLLQAQVEAEKSQLALQTAQNRHQAAWRRLASATGSPELAVAPLQGDFTPSAELQWDAVWERIRRETPELAAAASAAEQARWTLARAEREPLPNLNVGAGVQYDTDSRFTMANISAGVPLPIFNRNQGNIATAAADLSAAYAELQRIELRLRNRLAADFERYANARTRVEKYSRTILPSAKTALDVAAKGYQQGQFTYLQLLTAQRTYFEAHLALIDAHRELQAAVITIDGLLLTGALGDEAPAAGPMPSASMGSASMN